MNEKVEKIESISTVFNVLAWLALIAYVLTFMISSFNEIGQFIEFSGMKGFFISLYFLGAYLFCLCMQYFFYALYVIAKGSVKYLNNNND